MNYESENKRYISGIKKRDLKVFKKIFFHYHGRLVLFANKFVKDIPTAQDIVQDVFVNLWEKADVLTIEKSLTAYLFRSVRNSCINYNKKEIRRKSAKAELTNFLDSTEKQYYLNNNTPYISLLELEIKEKVYKIVESMPNKCKKVFILSRKYGLKNKEIACKLNISLKMVEKHISKALMIIRKELIDYLTCMLFIIISYF